MTLTFNAKTYYKKSHVIIIGISNYEEEDSLYNAYNDAFAMMKVLEEKYGFTKLIPPLFNKDATKAKIDEIHEDILPDEDRIGAEDRVLIFYSGHGILRPLPDYEGAENKKGYIVPYDSKISDFSSKIPMKDLVEGCQNCLAKHILLILDCCYSGYAALRTTLRKKPKKAIDAFLDQITSSRVIQVMAAGLEEQPVNDSGSRLGHSAFTGALLDILEGGRDLDNDGILTAHEIGSYLKREVARQTVGVPQNPVIRDLAGTGDFVFGIFNLSKHGVESRTQSFIYPGRVLKGDVIYQNDYIFEQLHIYSAHNLVRAKKSTAKIAIVAAGLPDRTHDAIKKIDIVPVTITGRPEKSSPKHDENSKIATALCALIASPLLKNNFIGVAPYSKLFVYDCGIHPAEDMVWAAWPADLASGILEAIKNKPQIMLVAMGSSLPYIMEQDLNFKKTIEQATREGITTIASAGYNEIGIGNGRLINSCPSALKWVLSVGSIDIDDTKSDFSNYGKLVDICAYGKGIVSAIPDKRWQILNGSPFQTCFVAGTVALMYTIDSKLTPKDVHEIIHKSADNIDYRNQRYTGNLGSGKLNAYKALIETNKKTKIKRIGYSS